MTLTKQNGTTTTSDSREKALRISKSLKAYRVSVGSDTHRPWEQHSRENLEYSARELGFSEGFIEELTDQELFNKIISEGCRQLSKMEG